LAYIGVQFSKWELPPKLLNAYESSIRWKVAQEEAQKRLDDEKAAQAKAKTGDSGGSAASQPADDASPATQSAPPSDSPAPGAQPR
jgi:hypothetical protein